jgi:dTDP-4-dehydrorhamnose 3,5-epimerase-like enzyme
VTDVLHIPGSSFKDERGLLAFFNTFDMTAIKRMYQIAPAHTGIIRAWQGHKIERKWFYCVQGSFLIQTVAIADFENPNPKAEVIPHQLTEKEPKVLHLPGGHASGIQALGPESKLLVFSDVSLVASKADDYRFPVDYWKTEWMVSS